MIFVRRVVKLQSYKLTTQVNGAALNIETYIHQTEQQKFQTYSLIIRGILIKFINLRNKLEF